MAQAADIARRALPGQAAKARAPLFGGFRAGNLLMPVVVVGILGLMIMPLPPLVLDFLLSINIALAVLILLTSINVRRPLDFSVFPSLLLVTTLLRLGLNVAVTRLILLNGAEEGDLAAGSIVKTFGEFVVGGNYVVGIVLFLILTLINFIVITKGSGRIAEVAARFTLDALPGKQMSIDADLAAGLVTQDEARARRAELARDTDFHGAMDGASKFVRGDAVAGLIITAINIIGGLIIGVGQHGMPIGEAAKLYTVLTIGDGLVSQIPALLISTSAGMVITRAAEESDLGRQVVQQTLKQRVVLIGTALVLGALMLVPGMPILPMAVLVVGLLIAARRLKTAAPPAGLAARAVGAGGEDAGRAPGGRKGEEDEVASLIGVHPVELQVGYSLVPLVGKEGTFIKRITGLRKNVAKDLGIIIPPLHVRDNLELAPGEYRLFIHEVEIARGTIMMDRLIALDPGDARGKLDGIPTTDPAFGLPALWIRAAQRADAELAGYTVVEPEAVLVTHLSEALASSAGKLLGRDDLQKLLEVVATKNPRAVEELLPSVLTHAELLAVLRALLEERVSIRNLGVILEALAEAARFGKVTSFLVDQVRLRIGAAIVQRHIEADGKLYAAIFDGASEDVLRQYVLRNEAESVLAPDLGTAQALLAQLQHAHQRMQAAGHASVIIAPADLRYPLRRFVSRLIPQFVVVSQNELPPRCDVITTATLSVQPRRPGAPPRPDARPSAGPETPPGPGSPRGARR